MNVNSAKYISKLSGIAIFAILALALAGSVANAQANTVQGITVTGHGEVMGTPDIAYVSLGIVTRDASASQAASENARVTTAITNAVKALGIADKDIQTQNFSVQPWYEYPQNAQPRLMGYEVRNSVRVTVRDIRKVGGVIDAGIKAGANDVQGVAFDISNDQNLRQEALTIAVRDARQKAQTIAEALGVKLGAPLSVTETSYRPPQPFFRGGVALESAGAPTPISPGELTISQDATVTFAILPR